MTTGRWLGPCPEFLKMQQSKLESLTEQVCKTTSGFVIAALVWAYLVAPLIRGGIISIDDPIIITVIFTVVSFARGYFWRRIFNKYGHYVVASIIKLRSFTS